MNRCAKMAVMNALFFLDICEEAEGGVGGPNTHGTARVNGNF